MRRTLLFDIVGTPLLGAWLGLLRTAEAVRPLRVEGPLLRRYATNCALAASAAAVERAVVLPALLLAARTTERRQYGLLRRLVTRRVPRFVASLLALDLGMYLWHRASHSAPQLWRYHAVHHCDPALDLSTAIRLHPGELLLSALARSAQVLLLGAGPSAVLSYELLMQIATLFHHSNVDLSARRDGVAASVFMTPRLHTRHHAATASERTCNWGIVLSLWDRMFGSLQRTPALDERLGTAELRGAQTLQVGFLYRLPYRAPAPLVR